MNKKTDMDVKQSYGGGNNAASGGNNGNSFQRQHKTSKTSIAERNNDLGEKRSNPKKNQQ